MVGLSNNVNIIHVSIYKDNTGALILAETLPPQFTPQKPIWFHEETVQKGNKLVKIDTVEHLGDMFTEALPSIIFEYLRFKLMG